MKKSEEQKNKPILSSDKNFEYFNIHSEKADEKYLIPEFDSETMDLEESEQSEEELDDKNVNKNIYNPIKNDTEKSIIIGTNSLGKKISILIFSIENVLYRGLRQRLAAEKYNVSFKIQKTECKLVRTILSAHGLHECTPSDNDYNLLWTGCHVRPFTLRTMEEYQKINHFPRSYELTRKDRLFKNVQRMQHIKGLKNFDFIPPSYLIPSEFQELCHNFTKDKGPYIVKPVALSRGRGIFLCNHPNQIPLDEQLIVSKYISNPYLIDDLKFDIRMYVLVTSYDPLVIYLYEEGLTRFATVKYHNVTKNLRTQCMHLTNYSVNKKSNNFVQNDDANIENFGNKWSLGALLRYLKSKDVDTTCLMMKIEDIIIKSLISVESQISASCRMFQPYRGNCFELYGYDIIIDENLRPWLLEVNLSPSLSCDSPLDFKVKSHMLSDMFNVIGMACHDPTKRNSAPPYGNNRMSKSAVRRSSPTSNQRVSTQLNTYNSNSTIRRPTAGLRRKETSSNKSPYKNEELRLVRRIKEESKRCGGWIRIFPAIESISTYLPFFHNGISDQTNMNAFTNSQINLNLFLHSQLYPQRHSDLSSSNVRLSANNSNMRSRLSLHNVNYNATLHKTMLSQIVSSGQSFYDKICSSYTDTQLRVPYYERKLGEELKKKSHHSKILTKEETASNDSDNEMSSSNSSTSDDNNDSENNSDSNEEQEEEDCVVNNVQSSESHSSNGNLSLEKIIESGGKMTKLQARQAFSCYLSRVQSRLLQESRLESTGMSSEIDDNTRHEQLELVLRFLKRAASNMLPEEFTVPSVPERSLTVKFRQEWLAKLLGEFIRIYSRETLSAKHSLSHLEIDNKTFLNFLKTATENELEQTLSNYTKVNKSAGIFLNANLSLKSTPPIVQSKPSYPPLGFHKSASMSNLAPKENPSKPPPPSTTLSPQHPQQDKSSKALSRPSSANHCPWRQSSTKIVTNNNRPATCSTQQRDSGSTYDHDAISKALQRLAADHRHRQLTASVSNLYDSDIEDTQLVKRNREPLTQALQRQYQQSKQLLRESRAKHSAILSSQNSFSDSRTVLVQKPPPGVRVGNQSRLSCTLKK